MFVRAHECLWTDGRIKSCMSSRVSWENKLCSRGIALRKSFMVLYRFIVMFLFFEDLNTLEHGLSVCTGNNSWYYIGVSRKSEGGGGRGAKNRFNFNTTKYIFMKLFLHVPYSVAYTNSCEEIQNFLAFKLKVTLSIIIIVFPISRNSYIGGIQNLL